MLQDSLSNDPGLSELQTYFIRDNQGLGDSKLMSKVIEVPTAELTMNPGCEILKYTSWSLFRQPDLRVSTDIEFEPQARHEPSGKTCSCDFQGRRMHNAYVSLGLWLVWKAQDKFQQAVICLRML